MTNRAERERSAAATQDASPRSRPFIVLITLVLCAALAATGFFALGTWQVKRLHWKRALIERVDQRIHAAPVPAPGMSRWPAITAETDEYRRVRMSGILLYSHTALVQASTELGSGFWVLTPLRNANDTNDTGAGSDADGPIVMLNLGFIPADAAQQMRQYLRDRKPGDCETGRRTDCSPTRIVGLLRISEPHGGFLRNNDPAADRWYSRDIDAIANARALQHVAPYFIDVQTAEPPPTDTARGGLPVAPVAGLTVVSFHNSHLVYALTWYALALMMVGAALWLVHEDRKQRRRQAGARSLQ